MPRTKNPRFAERVATNVSREERQALERYANARGFNLALVVRLAVARFIEEEIKAPLKRARAAS